MSNGIGLDPGTLSSVTVTITSPSGRKLSLFSDQNLTAPVTNPFTLNALAQVWVGEDVPNASVSMTSSGIERATSTGTALPYTFTAGEISTVKAYDGPVTDLIARGTYAAMTPTVVHRPGKPLIAPAGPDLGTLRAVTTLDSETFVYTLLVLDTGRILAGTSPNGCVYVSDDQGLSWVRVGKAVGGAATMHQLIDVGAGVILGATDATAVIVRSTDSGLTWGTVTLNASFSKVNCFADLGGGVVLAGTYNASPAGGYVYKSTDSGATWNAGTALGAMQGVDTILNLGGGIVLAGGQGEAGVIEWFRSTDSGATWTRLSSAAFVNGQYGHCSAYLGSGVAVVGHYDSSGTNQPVICRTTDSGQTWTNVYTATGVQGLFWMEYLGNGVVVAGTGINNPPKIIRSTDYGQTWADYQTSWSGDTTSTHVLCLAHLGRGVLLAGMGTSGKVYRNGAVKLSPTAQKTSADVVGYVGPPELVSYTGSTAPGSNIIYGRRCVVPFDGVLHDIALPITVQSGNVRVAVYDSGDASAGNITRLYDSGSVACPATNAWRVIGDPNLPVKRGQVIYLAFVFDNGTAQVLSTSYNNSGFSVLPSGFMPAQGGVTPRLVWGNAPGSFTMPTTIGDNGGAMGVSPYDFPIIARLSYPT